MAMAVDKPSEDALADAFLKEREWVSNHITMEALWNPLRTRGMITKNEEDALKKFMVQGEQVPALVDIVGRKGKLGEFYKLLKEKQELVITKLTPWIDGFEEQGSVNEAVKGQSQVDAAVKQCLKSLRYDQHEIDDEVKAILLSWMRKPTSQSDQAVAAPCSSLSTSPSSDELQSSSAPSPSDQVAIPEVDKSSNLRYIVIDGSNVAMSHGIEKVFSCKGIKICVDYFRERGHKNITVFVPKSFTCKAPQKHPISDQHILNELRDQGFLVYTPAKWVEGEHIVCYDDMFILNLAVLTGGIVVSNDKYKDLKNKKEEWREIIKKRVLGFLFANGNFMPPEDPYGRKGPHLDEFLRKSPTEDVAGSSSTPGVTSDQESQAGPASANKEPPQ